MKHILIIAFSCFCFSQAPLSAEETPSNALPYAIRIEGREKNVITTSSIRLEDLASVSGESIRDADQVIGLKKIFIADAPAAGGKITLSAAEVLERLSSEGIEIRKVGYRFPRVMTVERAARLISREELMTTIEQVLASEKESINVRSIKYDKPVAIAPGSAVLSAQRFHTEKPGSTGFSFRAEVAGEKPVEFTVMAEIDEWVEVPVARRPIPRGTVVAPGDMVMARLRVSDVPTDAAQDVRNVIGLETSNSIASGEIFRKRSLIIPPLIQSGDKVGLVYRAANFQATATGVAIEAGAEGQSIQVRNEASRKIITGILQADGSVLVQP
jgi:flagella basal body P-ring formation protein FlgA